MEQKDIYMLNRNALSSVRLTAQHFLWHRQLGWNLHPALATAVKASNDEIAVADVGCGNGIWIVDESANHPQTTQFYGFDISDAQFPLRQTWAPNVRFETIDAKGPVPDMYRGRFDVVHCRLIAGAIMGGGDALPFVNHFLDLLKPGGYLQWDEVNPKKLLIFPKEKAEPKWENFIVDMISHKRPGKANFDWVADRARLMGEQGMENIVELSGGDAKMELWRYWGDNEVAVMSEIATGIGAEPEVFEALAQGRQQGFDSHFELKVVIGRRSF